MSKNNTVMAHEVWSNGRQLKNRRAIEDGEKTELNMHYRRWFPTGATLGNLIGEVTHISYSHSGVSYGYSVHTGQFCLLTNIDGLEITGTITAVFRGDYYGARLELFKRVNGHRAVGTPYAFI